MHVCMPYDVCMCALQCVFYGVCHGVHVKQCDMQSVCACVPKYNVDVLVQSLCHNVCGASKMCNESVTVCHAQYGWYVCV